MAEKEALETVANLMVLAARTAPKTKGEDFIVCKIIGRKDKEKEKIAGEMEKISEKRGKGWARDAANVRDASFVVLIGVKANSAGVNCGMCGFDSCADYEKNRKKGGDFGQPICGMRLLDLGIALGSAAKTAGELNVDNRIMYRIGVAAKKLGITSADVIVGIPISGTGKNIFFDRKV